MAKREHVTNSTATAFGTGLTLTIAAFGAQIGNWPHWITIGTCYGAGVVLMLGSAVLITKSYFSQHPEHNAAPPHAASPRLNAPTEVTNSQLEQLTPLQKDALQLSIDLLALIERLGSEPAPKYTVDQLQRMTPETTRRLTEAEDGDYTEACEYHFGNGHIQLQTADGLHRNMMARMKRLWPWYEKVKASYALEFRDRVERISNRFAVEGMANDDLSLAVDGRDGIKNVRLIAARVWELAYRLREKAATHESN